MSHKESGLSKICCDLVEEGQVEAAVQALCHAAPSEIADLLQHLFRLESYHDKMGAAIEALQQDRYQEAIAQLAQVESEHGLGLRALSVQLQELSHYTTELSKENLSVDFPLRQNYVTMRVKNLHAKLNHLVWQIGQVANGDYSQTADYMGELTEGFNWMTSQLQVDRAQTEYELEHDKQTGLLNRNGFARRAQTLIRKEPHLCGVMLCSGLDNIKYINETYGYEAGDRYIAAAAKLLHSYKNTAVVARIAGDEFAIYVHGYKEEVNVEELEKAVNERISSEMIDIGEKVKLRSSFGLALYPQDAVTVETLLKYAGHTMFEVKKSNRGGFMRFDPSTYREKANTFDRQEKLNQLLDEKQLYFVFQPIFRLQDKSIYAYEALMRPGTESFSSPLEILTLAAEQSKLKQIEKITFELLFDWMGENISRLGVRKIFFNTITTEYMRREELQKLHPKYESFCEHLVFEVLESTAGSESFVREIEAFRQEMGVKVAIDDYGAGYSNDIRLIRIAPDIVKIDQFLISGIDRDKDKEKLLQKMVSYCNAKKIETLAEGVERVEELEAVRRLGFTYAQGFYLGMPEKELCQPRQIAWPE